MRRTRHAYSVVAAIEPPEKAVELLQVANQFDLPRLRQICENTIEFNFAFDDLENVITLLHLADLHRVRSMRWNL